MNFGFGGTMVSWEFSCRGMSKLLTKHCGLTEALAGTGIRTAEGKSEAMV